MTNEEFILSLINRAKGSGNNPEDMENEVISSLLDEVNLIKSRDIKDFVRCILLHANPLFWDAPSSNYIHPMRMSDEAGLGGIILHTQRVVRCAFVLGRAQKMTDPDLDVLIAAAILHDVTRALDRRGPRNTVLYDTMYPYTLDELVEKVQRTDGLTPGMSSSHMIKREDQLTILRLVRTHLGYQSPIPETYPTTILEWTLHLADHLCNNISFVLTGELNVEDGPSNNPKSPPTPPQGC